MTMPQHGRVLFCCTAKKARREATWTQESCRSPGTTHAHSSFVARHIRPLNSLRGSRAGAISPDMAVVRAATHQLPTGSRLAVFRSAKPVHLRRELLSVDIDYTRFALGRPRLVLYDSPRTILMPGHLRATPWRRGCSGFPRRNAGRGEELGRFGRSVVVRPSD